MYENVLNTNAKKPYFYKRVWLSNMTRGDLHAALYHNSKYNPKRKHSYIPKLGNKNGKGITYFDITAGFDCETYTDVQQELAYMYIWQICFNGYVIKGRTYDEFVKLLEMCQEELKPAQNNRLLVYIHNAGYEFSFFRGWLCLDDEKENFLKDQRTPLKFTHNHFIEFRDSCSLVGGDSLAGLAKNYCNTQKCVGDLDYTKPRTKYSYIDGVSESYCDNDVLILHEFSRYVFDNILPIIHKIPMTQTGLLTQESKQYIHEHYKGDQWNKIRIDRCPKDLEEYTLQANYLYRGGVSHANYSIVEQILYNLLGVDITSSYPFSSTQKIFPEKWQHDEYEVSEERVNRDIKNGLVSIFIAEFKGINAKTYHSIESKHKCLKLSANAVIDNGRVNYAEEMTVYLCSWDWLNYQRYYEWQGVRIYHYEYSETRYLYKHIAVPMLNHYLKKQKLKLAKENYKIEKSQVNSYYGLCVRKLNGDKTTYSNLGFSKDDAQPYEEQIARSIVCFYDGVFISAFSRYRLLQFARDVEERFHEDGVQAVYCDTDSWKFTNPSQALVDFIEERNKQIRCDNVKNIEYFVEYDEAFADLGEWEIEYYPASMDDGKRDVIQRFKTLGSKRYLIEYITTDKNTGERVHALQQTVAGLPKGELMKKYSKDFNAIFNSFDDKMKIEGCKLYAAYRDEPYTITVTDEEGNTDTQYGYSCCALLPSNFSLSMDEVWKQWYYEKVQEDLAQGRERRIE